MRGALNSLELSTDSLYKDINYRICLLQRQQILTTQSMLQQQMETLRDEKGRTLYSHTSGEVVEVHKCKKVLVKPRLNEEKCCEELAVWTGRGYEELTNNLASCKIRIEEMFKRPRNPKYN